MNNKTRRRSKEKKNYKKKNKQTNKQTQDMIRPVQGDTYFQNPHLICGSSGDED